MKIKNSIFPRKYTRYGKNFKIQNCLFQKDLQQTIFHRSYIFCLLIKNTVKKIKNLFLTKLRRIRKNLGNEFNNLYAGDIEHRAQSVSFTYFRAR